MIDWVTAVLPCQHTPLNAGCVMSIAPSGELEWSKHRALSVVGSFESRLQVVSIGGDGEGRATQLRIHGNPSKFLQGHNCFGSSDLLALMSDTYSRIVEAFGLTPTPSDLRSVERGAYVVSRVDYARMFSLPSRADVLAWLRAAEYKSKTRHGRPTRKGGTVYWGQHSLRWAFKGYCKAEELEAPKHRLPRELQIAPLLEWVENKLRLEMTLRTKELIDLNMRQACQITPEKIIETYQNYLGKIDMTQQIALTTKELHDLPTKLRSTYILWNSGEDLRDALTERTYYRHRKDLLKFGINIDMRKECVDRSNVVPLVRILEAIPASIPEFAFELGLVHRSACPRRFVA